MTNTRAAASSHDEHRRRHRRGQWSRPAVAVRFAAEGWRVALIGRRADSCGDGRVPRPGRRPNRDVPVRRQRARCRGGDGCGGARAVSAPSTCSSTPPASTCRNAVSRRLPLEDWHAVLATNLHGAYYCVRAFLPGCASGEPARSSTSTPTSARWRGRFQGPPMWRRSSACGADAADQCRGTRERRAGLLHLPARRQHAAPRQTPAAAGPGGSRGHAAARRSRRMRVARRDSPVARNRGRDLAVDPLVHK